MTLCATPRLSPILTHSTWHTTVNLPALLFVPLSRRYSIWDRDTFIVPVPYVLSQTHVFSQCLKCEGWREGRRPWRHKWKIKKSQDSKSLSRGGEPHPSHCPETLRKSSGRWGLGWGPHAPPGAPGRWNIVSPLPCPLPFSFPQIKSYFQKKPSCKTAGYNAHRDNKCM